MNNFSTKSYGRNAEVAEIYKMFDANRDVAMPGPRRLGKTFVLDRLVDAAAARGWVAVKVELAGCSDVRSVFRELCDKIGGKRTGGKQATAWFLQRLGQVFSPRQDSGGPWYQPFLGLDHVTYLERLIKAMNDDQTRRWALLIDELPIFLKALHDKGSDGVAAARDFMNLTSRLRVNNPKVRWMITGSIGIEPLAKEGNYMGVLAKYDTFSLEPLSRSQAIDYVKELAASGHLPHRNTISDDEAQALVDIVGWRSAYYLDALAQKLKGDPGTDAAKAQAAIDAALQRLLLPAETKAFGVWEEHLRKHYRDPDRGHAFAALAMLAPLAQGAAIDTIMAAISQPDLTRDGLHRLLTRLHVEGFLTVSSWDDPAATWAFHNLLLRRWWQRFPPQANA